MLTVEMPPPPPPTGPTVQELELRLALHSIYFPTAQPTPQAPQAGLLPSQQQTLTSLASDFQEYLKHKPDAHLILAGHADPRGSVPYNQALSERRVNLTKAFLVDHGVPADSIETKAFGHQKNLTVAQVKDAVESNPQVTPEERQKLLKNMRTILLASNRRVDVTLSTTGQESVKVYPFNAADSLTLLEPKQAAKTKPAAKKKMIMKKK
jgi:outer membrane protein OmpA-like peptidoglycan-associated protein